MDFKAVSKSATAAEYYEYVTSHASLKRGIMIDFGCGNGELAMIASRYNTKVIAIDSDREKINRLTESVSESGNIEAICGGLDVLRQKLRADDVDSIVLSNCIQYLDLVDLAALIKESTSVTTVYISTIEPEYYMVRLVNACRELDFHAITRYLGLSLKAFIFPYLAYRKTTNEKPPSKKLFIKLMNQHGFQVSDFRHFNIWGSLYPQMNRNDLFYGILFQRKIHD